jgi:hypothetical protein
LALVSSLSFAGNDKWKIANDIWKMKSLANCWLA